MDKKYTPEFLVSFKTAFHYASEADVFRLAYTSKHNSIWIDSDLPPSRFIANIIYKILVNYQNTSTLCWLPDTPNVNNMFFISAIECNFFRTLRNSLKHFDFTSLPKPQSTILNSFGPNKYNSILRELIEPARNCEVFISDNIQVFK